MKKFITFILLSLIALPVFSAEWQNIGQDLYLDKSSVRYIPINRTYKAWVKEVKVKEIVLYFNEYNLKTREWRNLDKVATDLHNNIKKREFNNHVGLNWLNVVPDTNSSKEYDAIKKQVQEGWCYPGVFPEKKERKCSCAVISNSLRPHKL